MLASDVRIPTVESSTISHSNPISRPITVERGKAKGEKRTHGGQYRSLRADGLVVLGADGVDGERLVQRVESSLQRVVGSVRSNRKWNSVKLKDFA